MIEDTIAIVSFFAIIIIFLVKMLNVVQAGQFYKGRILFAGFSLAWICWLLFFMSLSASIIGAETITTPDTETYTIESNNYTAYSMYFNLSNILISLITLFSIAEVLFLFNEFKGVKKPLGTRRKVNEYW